MKIETPTLIIDKKKCLTNIQQMTLKAKQNNLQFRPHFKTHQSSEIGNWFRNEGVNKITVSSVKMAEYFAKEGWKDILIAFPVNILEIDEINNLSQKINLHLLLESIHTVKFLDKNLKYPARVYLKIDTGYHRTGLKWDELNEIEQILSIVSKSTKLLFTGLLTHAGNSYQAKNKTEILEIHKNSIDQLLNLKSKITNYEPDCIISIGDTPTNSIATNFNGVNEIRPGNFVFYDVMQHKIGSCKIDQIAVALACPVVAIHSKRNEVVVYGGAVHLSKENIVNDNNQKVYGLIVKIANNGWAFPLIDSYISNLSQEHGIIKTTSIEINKIKVGDIIGILPVHSCLTANLSDHYQTFDNTVIPKF